MSWNWRYLAASKHHYSALPSKVSSNSSVTMFLVLFVDIILYIFYNIYMGLHH